MLHIRQFFLLVALLTSTVAFGQLTEDPEERREQGREAARTQDANGRPLSFGQRLRFGGGISALSFGNPASFGLSPVVAYQATERLIVGIGGTYIRTRYKAPFFVPTTFNQFGGRGFALYELVPSIIPNLYAHAEIENTSVRYIDDVSGRAVTGSLTAPLIGATYMQPISRRFGINLTALYNLTYNSNPNLSQAIYGRSPFIIRLSFF